MSEIRIEGARQHNLKNLSLSLPRNKLVVITGLSGSGKSSLAFDTLYAEGQRRYVESLSVYARQFLEQMEKPEVDKIEGLSPAIAIEQRSTGGNPRSTIATTTEIYDFLRLLFAHLGQPHHPKTGKPLVRYSVQQIVDKIMALPEGTRLHLLAPLVRNEKGEFRDVLEKVRRDGFVRARVDGEIVEVEHLTKLDAKKKHTIEAVVDRLKVKETLAPRLTDSVELALRHGSGVVTVHAEDDARQVQEFTLSNQNFDPETGYRFGELTPRHFSFNSPHGACPACHGLGTQLVFDPGLIIPDEERPLSDMPVQPWRRSNAAIAKLNKLTLEAMADYYGQSLETKWQDTSEEFRRAMLQGSERERIPLPQAKKGGHAYVERQFEGLMSQLQRQYDTSKSETTRQRLSNYMSRQTCPVCNGARLKPDILAVTIAAGSHSPINIDQVTRLSITSARRWLETLEGSLSEQDKKIGGEIVREIVQRLGFLEEVGLGYLTLNRESGTLSGGEAQRIRLATQIGSKLTGVLYILDEPSIGLHQRDNERLLATLKELRDLGNSVVVVEHDEDTMRQADWLVDLGPAAGARGGYLVAAGSPEEVMSNPDSLTGQYLSGQASISVPKVRIQPREEFGWLTVHGAKENNLKEVTAAFPLGLLTCVTGVSGSGKSTLVNDILRRTLSRYFYRAKEKPGAHEKVTGLREVDKVIVIDQTPIGRTPRSNPLTYTGAFNDIRALFANLPMSRVRGYGPGRFSTNVRGGRCEHCEGTGVLKLEMNFLPTVYVPCEACGGKRFNRETLEVLYKGLNISDVLDMTVDEGLTFFRNVSSVHDKLEALAQVGLGYLHLGQTANNLSGGEAQRVKLATELAKKSTGRTVYILDEPTTGLHFGDIDQLVKVLYRLRNAGNTLIVIEHQLDVIKCADWVIDMGPEGGDAGGEVIAKGTPEQVAAEPRSHTGRFLKKMLGDSAPTFARSGFELV